MLRYFQTISLRLALLSLCLSSCVQPSIQLQKNEYDQTVRFASNRLDGKRQKTKHVKALEAAFAQANQEDLDMIERFRTIGTPLAWEHIHATHLRMQQRQARVEPLLPLVSDDGYRPDIRLLPIQEMLAESRQEVIARYFDQIKDNMELARTGKRLAARSAFARIHHLQQKYDWDDPAAVPLAEEALAIGKVYVLVEINNTTGYFGSSVMRRLSFRGIGGTNPWQVVHESPQPGIHYDFGVKTRLAFASVSMDNLNTTCRTVSEDIEVGKEAVTDTSGKVTYKPIYKTVTATIQDITATKDASITAYFEAYDYATGQSVRWENIYASDHFSESFCAFTGDSRVASTACCRSSSTVFFPTDWQMMDNCADDLRNRLNCLLSQVDVHQ